MGISNGKDQWKYNTWKQSGRIKVKVISYVKSCQSKLSMTDDTNLFKPF